MKIMKMVERNKTFILLLIVFQILALFIIQIYDFDAEFDKNENEEKKVNYKSFNIKSSASGYSYEQQIKPVGSGPISVDIGDADNDGQNDIVTSNYDDDTISILLWNASKGDWEDQITKSVGSAPRKVRIEDANNDGQNDIIIANSGDDTVSIFLWNASKGDWEDQITKSVGWDPLEIHIGDANNDGQNDIVASNYYGDTISILLWNTILEDWDLQLIKTVGNRPSSVYIGDANNDGQNDIVASNYGDDDTVSILLWNTNEGDWDAQITKPVGFNPQSVCIGDVNYDGQNDIVTSDISGGTISILSWNNTNNDWNELITKSAGGFPRDVCIGDANNDLKNDIVVVNEGSNTVSFLYWDATIENWNPRFTEEVGQIPRSVCIGDANNDGQNDVVSANAGDNTVSILMWYDHTSPTWDELPIDQVIEVDSTFFYDVNASDFSGIDHYWINDTMNFQLDINGIITNTTSLLTGKYWLEIRAYDIFNNSCSVSIKITVRENIVPTWDELPIDQVIELGSTFFYDINASDLSGIAYYWINDTTNFNIYLNGLITEVISLNVGEYWLEIRSYDLYNNNCSAIISITVVDTTLPTWDLNPLDQTVELGNYFYYDINASDLSGIAYYWINDTTNFYLYSNGLITEVTSLNIGEYWLEIRAYDRFDNYCIATIKIIVRDPGRPLNIPGYKISLISSLACITIVGVINYIKKKQKKISF